MTRCIAIFAALGLGSAAVNAATPEITNNVYFNISDQQFHVITAQQNTPRLGFYLWANSSTRWDASGYTAVYKWSTYPLAADAAAMNSITGTVSGTSVWFTVYDTNFVTACQGGYAVLALTKSGEGHSYARGRHTVLRAPEFTGSDAWTAYTNIYWAMHSYSGTASYGPYIAGTNIVFGAPNNRGQIPLNVDSAVSSGDITAVNITAGTGLVGTVSTATGAHNQTLSLNGENVAVLGLSITGLTENAAHLTLTRTGRSVVLGETGFGTAADSNAAAFYPRYGNPSAFVGLSYFGAENRSVIELGKWVYYSGAEGPFAYWGEMNDGPGSGLDADLLHGLDSLAFVKADGSVPMTGTLGMGGNNITNVAYLGFLGRSSQLYVSATDSNLYLRTDEGGVWKTRAVPRTLGKPLDPSRGRWAGISQTGFLMPTNLVWARVDDRAEVSNNIVRFATNLGASAFHPLNGNPSGFLVNGSPVSWAKGHTVFGPSGNSACIGNVSTGSVDAQYSLVVGENCSYTGHHSLVVGQDIHMYGGGNGNQAILLGRNIRITPCIEDSFVWNDGTTPFTSPVAQNSANFAASGGLHVIGGPVTSNGVPYSLKTDVDLKADATAVTESNAHFTARDQFLAVEYHDFILHPTNKFYRSAWIGPWDETVTLVWADYNTHYGTAVVNVIEQPYSWRWDQRTTNATLYPRTNALRTVSFADSTVAVSNRLGLFMSQYNAACTNVRVRLKLRRALP